MVDAKKCTGCSACVAACPKNAIQMKADTEGFLQPVIQKALCVSCGRCDRVCPVEKRVEAEEKRVAACRSSDSDLVSRSSSGGVFSQLAEGVLNERGVVFGCSLSESQYAEHICIDSKEELDRLRRSKYVQSDKRNTFVEVKEQLKIGRRVLFVGTPCEVAGLRSYLGKEYDNLLLVDFICHGVPSPQVWRKYIEARQRRQGAAVSKVSFRNKSRGWRHFSMELSFENGTSSTVVLTEDDYLRGFLQDLYLRKSCYSCVFKDKNYRSDLTIGDFFAVNRVIPEIDHDEGTSLVVAHTQRGMVALREVEDSMLLRELDSSALDYNDAYRHSVKLNFWREQAICELQSQPFHKVIERYCGLSIGGKIRRKVSELMAK